ncbi:MAG TPA: DUF4405 domain-containing protein, partial [Anaerolineales bacterium]|nr:DUF4405 domain-containing protein [Anaerolineales bacterium]
ALALYHLLAHWQWIGAVTEHFFGRTPNKSRLYYLINAALLAGFLGITLTGLIISSWLDLTLSNTEPWLTIHILASIGTLILVTIKIVLHWRWIAVTTRKVFSPPPAPAARPAPVTSTPSSSGQISRAEFLKVAGFACAASLLALTQAVHALGPAETAVASTELASQASNVSAASQTSSNSGSSLNSASQTCSVRCDKRCTYPGHCHRYTDSNGNGRCDYGECA